MKKIYLAIICSTVLIFSSCTGIKTEKSNGGDKNLKASISNGFLLLEQNCFSCHSPDASSEEVIAPTLASIKKHYVSKNISEEEFTKSFIAFMDNPSQAVSKMPDAIEKFGLMLKMDFTFEQLESMANYIYIVGLENPGWFENNYEVERKNHNIALNKLTVIEKGQQIVSQTKIVLGKNLLNAINSKGVEHALEFCSVKAIPLTDSMSLSMNAEIKRVTDKNRNPGNAANDEELEYISHLKNLLANNEKPSPKLVEKNGKWAAYYPILTDRMCLQCHGQKNTEILPAILNKINKLYPTDKAFGYKENDLRGIWVVEMKK